MLNGGVRFEAAEDPIPQDRSRSAIAMAGLFAPLDDLLGGGGDPRLGIGRVSGVNEYGCTPGALPGYAELCLEHRDIDFGARLRLRGPRAGANDTIRHR